MLKKLLGISWGLAVIGLIFLSTRLQGETEHFFGIAEDRERVVSFEMPVQIVRLPFLEGEEVKRGDLIIKVQREDLRAEKAVVDAQIQELSFRNKVNHTILQQLEKEKTTKSGRASKQDIHGSPPADAETATLLSRQSELQRQMESMQVLAEFDGHVGSVLHKTGEVVAPFQPILTVHGSKPEYINGYIHEDIINKVKTGQKVWIQSISHANGGTVFGGVVESMGTRIVEYPVRLKKNPLAAAAWGREVVIRISAENELLFGEKVIVMLEQPVTLAVQARNFINAVKNTLKNEAQAGESAVTQGLIESTDAGIEAKSIEASAVLQDISGASFLLVSDEGGDAAITRMNADGKISAALPLSGCPKVSDLESISRDGDDTYVLSSLSYTHNGELKQSRRWLLRMVDKGNVLACTGSVDLYQVLETLAKEGTDSQTSQFLAHAMESKEMDIEAHRVKDNALLIGFKSPLDSKNMTAILRIENLKEVFSGAPPLGRIWKTFALVNSENGAPMHVSDMLLFGETLLVLSVTDDPQQPVSQLTSYDLQSGQLKNLDVFSGLKAEGISRMNNSHEFLVVFDEGGKFPSRFQIIQSHAKKQIGG